MGHRLSKTSANGCNATRQVEEEEQQQQAQLEHKRKQTHHAATSLPHYSTEANTKPTSSSLTQADREQLLTTATSSSSCPRQIIIKIQLAKMENELQQIVVGSESSNANDNSSNSSSKALLPSNNNGTQFLNLSFNRQLTCGELTTPTIDAATTASNRSSLQHATSKKSDKNLAERTAGGSSNFVVNNNFSPNVLVTATPGRQDNFNILMGPMSELHIDEKRMSAPSTLSSLSSSGGELAASNVNASLAEEQQVAANDAPMEPTYVEDANDLDNEYCCRRKSKSTTFPSKWRCCKCTCRDAFRRIMDASSSKSSKKKERKEANLPKIPTQQHSSEPTSAIWTPLQTNSPLSGTPRNNVGGNAAANGNAAPQMSIWSPSTNDVIIPISSPQFVVVQCPPSSLVTLGRIDDNAIRLMATELVASSSTTTPHILSAPADASATPGNSSTNSTSSGIVTPNRGVVCATAAIATGPVVHSQVDYIHCLVPDLERITKASFYWGKMDRYEAERLLEGKPEGTFLLRDSAQEEYLFSVTFRKYGRSLHARIEQSNHKFSFDCHDPCVFTAPTVTGLLEHYKDPACVMFFEPMLTIPLHRSTTFTLQQLCRATIVSNTSYDGINELELPSRLKSYLKEYHYKQKLRVKPFDEPFYACT